jgi:hypothetical protein
MPLESQEARCATHPDRPAVGACARCGTFFCEPEGVRHGGETWCGACDARPELRALETLVQTLWGRRDAWAWVMGVSVPLHISFAAAQGVDERWGMMAFGVANALVTLAYFLGVRQARVGLVVLPPLWGVGLLAIGREWELVLPLAAVPLTIAVVLYQNLRNKLFFRIPLSRAQQERLWDDVANNPTARRAFLCSVLGLYVPGASLVAIGLGVLGLRRVDPLARPPQGKRGYALAAIALGIGGIVLWIYFLYASLTDNSRLGLELKR